MILPSCFEFFSFFFPVMLLILLLPLKMKLLTLKISSKFFFIFYFPQLQATKNLAQILKLNSLPLRLLLLSWTRQCRWLWRPVDGRMLLTSCHDKKCVAFVGMLLTELLGMKQFLFNDFNEFFR